MTAVIKKGLVVYFELSSVKSKTVKANKITPRDNTKAIFSKLLSG
jgi:hypothetical protein